MSPSPPASLNCRETAPPLIPKYAKDARISRFFLVKPDWRERTTLQKERQRPGFSPQGSCIVRFREEHEANAMRSEAWDSSTVS